MKCKKDLRKQGAPAVAIQVANVFIYGKWIVGRHKGKYVVEIKAPYLRSMKIWNESSKPPFDVRLWFLLGALIYPFYLLGVYLFVAITFLLAFLFAPFMTFYEEMSDDTIIGWVYLIVSGSIYTFGLLSLLNLIFGWV